MEVLFSYVLEFFFILSGLIFFYSAYQGAQDRTNPKRWGTAAFWAILGLLFVFGRLLPGLVSGILVVLLGVITLFKQFGAGTAFVEDKAKQEAAAKRFGWKLFLPVLVMALSAVIVARLIPESSASSIGIGSLLGTLVALALFKPSAKEALYETDRMTQQVGTTSILPQLLAALGVIFVNAGVGEIVAQILAGIVPAGSKFWGIVAYVLGMVFFTAVMGNAFSAFTVITAGIGVPFVLMQGADPVVVGALGMTAGFCGTLLTPMAGNFNALPVALLEMTDPNGVIKRQLPFALIMIVVHIVLLYIWAF
ncbi:DUF979 domain-containing protein [Aerococcus sanguinicola]|uniref:DUF979 domain-containing protein n=1 Tax=unclassified Aerococcus TaxID=2618060 RepID=UPI0008A17B65|nr:MULTISPECIES: DUF979 domain-containing protein [unclassified Aerococcus]MDK6232913.1 DUF979 domain-containing protein [Aerococcus sp. UMB10185]MDK6805137.1 DUF979 domain-containing protein [Aerococcus sp. UMB7834]MDK6855803.1 DUF979 domain-containing protein [Aerococcus sp. UMB7533]MDK8502544.1 DUF979 domain-containing protein [Aerococcus sp. UMB1112A]OFN03281.1 hypothetical protein HMPREF2626_00915 [Aerococcus sp. HMSC062A02]